MSKHIGRRFGKLVIKSAKASTSRGGHPVQKFIVQCDCGAKYERRAATLLYAKEPDKQQCLQCKRDEDLRTGNEGYRHPLHGVWQAMISRCHNEDDQNYHYYGGRGISVCDEWRGERPNGELRTMDGFRQFVADMGPRPEGYTIDRKNPNSGYTPHNCSWETWDTQAKTKRIRKTLVDGGITLTLTLNDLDTPHDIKEIEKRLEALAPKLKSYLLE